MTEGKLAGLRLHVDHHSGRPGLPFRYVSAGDLPWPASTLVAVDHRAYATPAVTDERWRTLVGRPELKGVKGTAVAIIAAEAVGQPTHFIPILLACGLVLGAMLVGLEQRVRIAPYLCARCSWPHVRHRDAIIL
jgi:hypothetical protein